MFLTGVVTGAESSIYVASITLRYKFRNIKLCD